MQYDSSTYTDLTDEELVQRVQDGDEEAFAQLAARYSSRIWHMVVLNSRQIRDAEEIFQDIWVAVWENISGLREVSSFGAWLRKIAYTTCRRYYTANSRTGGEILQSAEQLAESIDRDVLARFREMELRAAVTEAVHHLPEKVRTVAVLYYLEMWTVKEIATENSIWRLVPSRQDSAKFGHSYARNLVLKKLKGEVLWRRKEKYLSLLET